MYTLRFASAEDVWLAHRLRQEPARGVGSAEPRREASAQINGRDSATRTESGLQVCSAFFVDKSRLLRYRLWLGTTEKSTATKSVLRSFLRQKRPKADTHLSCVQNSVAKKAVFRPHLRLLLQGRPSSLPMLVRPGAAPERRPEIFVLLVLLPTRLLRF